MVDLPLGRSAQAHVDPSAQVRRRAPARLGRHRRRPGRDLGPGAEAARESRDRPPSQLATDRPTRSGSRRSSRGSATSNCKLEEVTALGDRPARSRSIDQDTLVKIRPRFDNALVEKVFVSTGQSVKKGDPLLIIRSAELALAKNDCRTKFVQWDHDHKYLIAREPLAKDGRITQIIWTDTVNDEKKSRLDYLVSREKLATYGMTNEQIDKLLEGLSDDRKKAWRPATTAGHHPDDGRLADRWRRDRA